MKQIRLFFFSLLMLLFVCSCSGKREGHHQKLQNWQQENGHLKVLSTTGMINDLVEHIGGSHVDTLILINEELDPHSYQLVKGDDEKLSSAQIIFYNGLGLEHGPSLASYLQKNPKAIPLGDYLEKQNAASIIKVNGQRDPHIWMDVSLWMQAIPLIVEQLSEKDPAHRADFIANADALRETLTATHQEVTQIMHEVPESKRYLVTSHDAFNYFTRAYLSEPGEVQNNTWEKRFAAPEGLAPESQLSTTDIQFIIDHMYQHNIHVLFPESTVSRDSINKIVQAGRDKGLDLRLGCCPLYSDALGEPGSDGDTYSKMLVYNAKMIASYLKE